METQHGEASDRGTVALEYYSWLSREFGSGQEGSTIVQVPLTAGWTVRALLADLAAKSEAFQRIVYDLEEGRLREYVTLIVNGQMVELAGGLDRPLRDGDYLLLLPGFSGG